MLAESITETVWNKYAAIDDGAALTIGRCVQRRKNGFGKTCRFVENGLGESIVTIAAKRLDAMPARRCFQKL